MPNYKMRAANDTPYRLGGVVLSDASSVVHEAEIALISAHLRRVVLEHLLHLGVALHTEVNVVSLLQG